MREPKLGWPALKRSPRRSLPAFPALSPAPAATAEGLLEEAGRTSERPETGKRRNAVGFLLVNASCSRLRAVSPRSFAQNAKGRQPAEAADAAPGGPERPERRFSCGAGAGGGAAGEFSPHQAHPCTDRGVCTRYRSAGHAGISSPELARSQKGSGTRDLDRPNAGACRGARRWPLARR